MRTHECLALAAACMQLAACASPSPRYDALFGEAVRRNAQSQLLSTTVVDNPGLSQGLDGGAARDAVQRYRESFRNVPSPPPVIQIGVGR